jgi:phage tail tape-measure protein
VILYFKYIKNLFKRRKSMRGSGWRRLDNAIQRDLERAKSEGAEAFEKASKEANMTYSTTGGAQAGALLGGAIGSGVPVIGTIVGAVVGAVVGGVAGYKWAKHTNDQPSP